METKRYNQNLASDPLSDPIMKIITGARNFKLLENAIEMGIFDDLETSLNPVSAERLAKKHEYNVDMLTRFLDALCSLQLIGKTNAKGKALYYNVATSSKYLTRSRRPSLVPTAMMEGKVVLPMIDNMITMMQNGKGVDVMAKKTGVDATKLIQVPNQPTQLNNNHNSQQAPPKPGQKGLEMQMKFLMCMDGFAAACAPALAKAFDLSTCRTAVDFGCGSGAIGIEIAKTYEAMQVVMLDLPNVIQLARKMNPSLPDNAAFCSGNFFEDDLPEADLYILGHVIHDWDDDHVTILLNKIYDSMPAGGSLLIHEKILEPKKDGPELAVTNNLIMSMITKGRERTEQEYRILLLSHGFVNIVVRRIDGCNTYDAILTSKPLNC